MKTVEHCDVVVRYITSYIRYSIYMENFNIKMSTASKVKSIDLLLHLFGIFDSHEYLEYLLSDMEHVYVKYDDANKNKTLDIKTINNICNEICKIYDNIGFGRDCIMVGEEHTQLYIHVREYLEKLF